MNIGELEALSLPDLRAKSKELEIQGATRLKKEDLILRLMQAADFVSYGVLDRNHFVGAR